MEGGKLSTKFPNYRHTSEISGGKLIEVSKSGTLQKMVYIRGEKKKDI